MIFIWQCAHQRDWWKHLVLGDTHYQGTFLADRCIAGHGVRKCPSRTQKLADGILCKTINISPSPPAARHWHVGTGRSWGSCSGYDLTADGQQPLQLQCPCGFTNTSRKRGKLDLQHPREYLRAKNKNPCFQLRNILAMIQPFLFLFHPFFKCTGCCEQ